MALLTVISLVGAKAMMDAFTALFNVGGASTIEIRTGTQPALTTTADSGTLLAVLTCNATAFAAAGTGSSPQSALSTANAITSDTSADNTGTAGYFRAKNNAGVVLDQGNCGTSGTDMILNTTSIVSGSTVSCSAWTINLPTGGA